MVNSSRICEIIAKRCYVLEDYAGIYNGNPQNRALFSGSWYSILTETRSHIVTRIGRDNYSCEKEIPRLSRLKWTA